MLRSLRQGRLSGRVVTRKLMERLLHHEALQMTMLQWLKSKRFLGSLAFGEGTMLRLCHELPRHSLDMDFWFFKEVDYERFFNRLTSSLSGEYNITDTQNTHYFILLEIQREEIIAGLKIIIHKAMALPGSTEEKIAFSSYFPTQVLVRGFTLTQMLRNKVAALIKHAEIQDAFDLEFLVRKGVALNLSEEKKKRLVMILKGFKKRDFEVKLGSILQPDLKMYYRRQGFAYLKEKLYFDQWGNEGEEVTKV